MLNIQQNNKTKNARSFLHCEYKQNGSVSSCVSRKKGDYYQGQFQETKKNGQ